MNSVTTIPTRRRTLSPLFSMFDDVFGGFFDTERPDHRVLAPAVNVVESDTTFTIDMELPGVAEKDIQVQVHGDQLTVNAERKFDSEKRDGDYHRVEHRYGAFSRSLTLPREIEPDGVSASYENGILTVVVPKSERTASRRIEVKGKAKAK